MFIIYLLIYICAACVHYCEIHSHLARIPKKM